MLEKNGVSSDRVDFCMDHVNDLSNLQFLATIPNIEKQNKDFDDWFARICPTDSEKAQYRADNYLPKMDYMIIMKNPSIIPKQVEPPTLSSS